MSTEEDKIKHSKRLLKDENAIKKQVKIAKAAGMTVREPHKFVKKHAMDCGNPECFLCGNPRKTHKDSLTMQEKSFKQTEKWDGE
jgi:hypothetical protein